MKPRYLLAALSVVACGGEPQRIWSGEAALGEVPLVVTPLQPTAAAGPTHRVCVVPDRRGVRVEQDSLLLPDGESPWLRVTLVTSDGQLDSLWNDGYFTPLQDAAGRTVDSVYRAPYPPPVELVPGAVCVWNHREHDSTRVLARVELRSGRPLPIREVRWWSGRVTKVLF